MLNKGHEAPVSLRFNQKLANDYLTQTICINRFAIFFLTCYNICMHELPITQQIIKIADQHCLENGGSKVLKVNLVIGEYSGYVGEAIQNYFDVITEGTLCEGAVCEVRRVEPKLKCNKCGRLFKKQLLTFDCPYCDGQGEQTDIGKEFYIDTIEIE